MHIIRPEVEIVFARQALAEPMAGLGVPHLLRNRRHSSSVLLFDGR